MSDTPTITAVPAPRLRRGLRLFLFYSSAVLLTGVVSLLFADLLWRTGWSTARTVLLTLFIILFLLTAIGCMHGVYGFFIRIFGTHRRITGLKPYKDQKIDGVSTAIVFPIYNEDSVRVLEGLRTTYESLERTGQLGQFDFFILSDSTNPDRWVEEERRWSELICDLDALGKIYYRRRLFNEERKSGNIRDFLNTWGKRYRYFIVFDADSEKLNGDQIVGVHRGPAQLGGQLRGRPADHGGQLGGVVGDHSAGHQGGIRAGQIDDVAAVEAAGQRDDSGRQQ